MRTILRAWICAAVGYYGGAPATAALIQGFVVENQTGHPLARTEVTLTPVPGTAGTAMSVRTTTYGAFSFGGLAPGASLVSPSRKGFATIQYGQKQYKSAGLPVILDETQKAEIEIRLPRM